MRPNLLKTFLAVAHRRNITHAAAEVHLAQSSVSDQIQLLENEVGTRLFTRSKIGLELTPAGAVFKPYAEEILSLMDEARSAVETAAEQVAGPLIIGALETIAAAKMPEWLSAFRNEHSGIHLQIRIASSGELFQKLESGDINAAFCFDKGDLGKRFFKRAVSAEPLVLVAPPDEQPGSIGDSLDSLAARNFVATEAGCVYRHMFSAAFAQAGIAAPRPVAEVDSIRTIARLVASGTGLALVPRLAVIDALGSGDLLEMPWPGPLQTVPLVAIWRRHRVQPPALKQFLACVDAASAQVKPADARLRHAVPSPS